MTDKQQAIYDEFVKFFEEEMRPPTIREIAIEFGITVKGAYDHLKAINKKGYLEHKGFKVPFTLPRGYKCDIESTTHREALTDTKAQQGTRRPLIPR